MDEIWEGQLEVNRANVDFAVNVADVIEHLEGRIRALEDRLGATGDTEDES